MKSAIISISLFFLTLTQWEGQAFGQLITWRVEAIDSVQQVGQKPVVVFLHTDWCKYCRAMENTTFREDEVIDVLNRKVYFISFNAESKEDVVFNNYIFSYIPRGRNTGTHELADALGTINGKLHFPVICILNPENEIIFQHSGYLTKQEVLKIIESL